MYTFCKTYTKSLKAKTCFLNKQGQNPQKAPSKWKIQESCSNLLVNVEMNGLFIDSPFLEFLNQEIRRTLDL